MASAAIQRLHKSKAYGGGTAAGGMPQWLEDVLLE
jgi:hypothetical protein